MSEQRKNKTDSALTCYDLTIPSKKLSLPDTLKWMRTNCKHWTFQEEIASTGYTHYQCRFLLKNRKRESTMITQIQKELPAGSHISPTTTPIYKANDDFYVMKPETRIAGPWSDKNDREEVEISKLPKHLQKEYVWRPFQQSIIDSIKIEPDDRTINVLYCPSGGIGKSRMAMWLQARKLARRIPPLKSYKDVMRMIKGTPKVPIYFIDLPKAHQHSNNEELYCAIENIKDGYAWDDRYEWSEEFFEIPHVWVFTNEIPDHNLLSRDRWKYWTVTGFYELVDFVPPTPLPKITVTKKLQPPIILHQMQ